VTPQFHLYLPQMRLGFDALVARARAAEAAGFDGIALMDHLAPPMAESQPMYEAFVSATWLAAHTDRLTLGHLVLCDSLRHPAVLAREAVSLDHASAGRFELGLGSGSMPEELERFGVGSTSARQRTDRLRETLEVVQALWTGEPVDHGGSHHSMIKALQRPTPLAPIPIVIGGTGPRTMALVAEHADWWNLPLADLERLDELRPLAGKARVSAHQLVTLVPSEDRRSELVAVAERRFGFTRRSGWVAGTADELVRHFREFNQRGVERFYTWFTDFADLDTLARFGEVIERSRAT
jgi:alkanesulfonate monooxygenase SsuD/methylene tetrahydromethanopterin reductase-like flavin-dependent oxidoreductase (luciferase family)